MDINVGISVDRLTDHHLLSEYRQLSRIPELAKDLKISDSDKQLEFRSGVGQQSFLLTKGEYTFNRFVDICKECEERGFKVYDCSDDWVIYDELGWSDYVPDKKTTFFIKYELLRKVQKMKVVRYYGKEITLLNYTNILENGKAF